MLVLALKALSGKVLRAVGGFKGASELVSCAYGVLHGIVNYKGS